jgi:glycosyltransferase involved in cell wall biosynthesis
MSVRNGGEMLAPTLASVLSQEQSDFEFIVVNDGSTDASGSLLDDWARRHSRLRVIHQANTGLTRALIRGCSQARGEFIARQDAGDISVSGRLAAQMHRLRRDPTCVAVCCHADFVGPKDEFLYRMAIPENTLNERLTQSVGNLGGPAHHGSVMMRAETYRLCGGYREAFYFAQDLDLWARLVEHGRFGVIDDVYYRAVLLPASISGTRSAEQRQLASLIARLAAARRAGADESDLLAQAARVTPGGKRDDGSRLAQGNYFIGSCLHKTASRSAQAYFEQALRLDPWHWRARVRVMLGKAGF